VALEEAGKAPAAILAAPPQRIKDLVVVLVPSTVLVEVVVLALSVSMARFPLLEMVALAYRRQLLVLR
jgi:hypothetical protein